MPNIPPMSLESGDSPSPSATMDTFGTGDIEDDLAIFGEQTRVLDRKCRQAAGPNAISVPVCL